MDQPRLDSAVHVHALRGLERINWLSGSDRILWPPIETLAREHPKRSLRILDIAAGGGDVVVRMWRRSRRANLKIEFQGADVSPTALEHSCMNAQRAGAPIGFFTLDVLRDRLPEGYDVLMTSLFLHHLDDEQALSLMRRMGEAARQMVLINDLRRSRTGYVLAWAGSRLLTSSHVVHVDAPRSVAAAFALHEIRALADRAGLADARITRRWPCRFLLCWKKSRAERQS
ncbi:MAG: methyltransferase domain-containing protein [Planctomycetes bacterium]|nr:methyltransferase domain-containing protein [Planctomycetota bacterium]